MPRKTLRDEFRPVIAAVLESNAGKPLPEVRAALREAFPMGLRKYWPYKVWLSEIRRQLGGERPLTRASSPLFDGLEVQ